MLVNDRKEIRYVGISPQCRSLRMQIKQFCVVGTVFASLNLSISDREEDEFHNNSNIIDTHNPNIQGGINPCMYM